MKRTQYCRVCGDKLQDGQIGLRFWCSDCSLTSYFKREKYYENLIKPEILAKEIEEHEKNLCLKISSRNSRW